jgi:hypothetical protein
MNYKCCFVIAQKYYRNYKSYIKYYVDNIQNFYPDSFILIVDNNSRYLEDVTNLLKNYNNLKIIINNIECKFEIGAYNEAIRYIKKENLLNNFEYFIFSQDTFVLKNKFDIQKELVDKNIFACSFNCFENDKNILNYQHNILKEDPICINILKKINCLDKIEECNIAWCSSFILHKSKIYDYYDIVKDEIITERFNGSIQSERYLSAICYYLNNNNYVSLCGNAINPNTLGYDCWKVDIENDKLDNFFVKKVQQKNEKTKD